MRHLAAGSIKTVNKVANFGRESRIFCTFTSAMIGHVSNESIFVGTYYLPGKLAIFEIDS